MMRRSELPTWPAARRVPEAPRRISHKKAFAFSPSDDDDGDEAQDGFRDWVRRRPLRALECFQMSLRLILPIAIQLQHVGMQHDCLCRPRHLGVYPVQG